MFPDPVARILRALGGVFNRKRRRDEQSAPPEEGIDPESGNTDPT